MISKRTYKSYDYETLLTNIILKMQDGSRNFNLPQNDYLIVGDTNLTGEGNDLKEKETDVRNTVERLLSKRDPTGPRLLDITDGNTDEMIFRHTGSFGQIIDFDGLVDMTSDVSQSIGNAVILDVRPPA